MPPRYLIPALLPILLAQTAPSELDRLRTENQQLRDRLKSLESQQPTTKPTTATTTAATKPAPRPFTNMPDLLANIPADLRPQPHPDWYTFTESKFLAAWKQQLVGLSFDQSLPFIDCAITRSNTPTPGAEWKISFIRVDGKSFQAFGTSNQWSLESLTFFVDEPTAKRWTNLKKGTLIKIKTTIISADIRPAIGNTTNTLPSYQIVFHLHDSEVTLPN